MWEGGGGGGLEGGIVGGGGGEVKERGLETDTLKRQLNLKFKFKLYKMWVVNCKWHFLASGSC